jgi:glutamyl-tRNA reductase
MARVGTSSETAAGRRDKPRVAVIGAGRIGRVHSGNLARRVPRAVLVALSDVVGEVAQQCAEQLGVPTAVSDYREILGDAGVDAVAICSSTDTHAQIIEDAAAAGKHIFCEKPIDFDLARIDRALSAVAEVGADNLGALPDTFHMNIEERSIAESIRRAADRIIHFHVADSNRWPRAAGISTSRRSCGCCARWGTGDMSAGSSCRCRTRRQRRAVRSSTFAAATTAKAPL